MSMETWRTAIEEIPKIISGEPNADKAILLDSLFSLQERFDRMDNETVTSNQVASESSEYEATDSEGERTWILETIQDELIDSEMYYNKFLESKITEYKEISKEELRHSEAGFKRAREVGIPESELQELMLCHNMLLAKLA